MAKRATLTYDKNWYIPSAIKAKLETDPAAVRKEYTRLRDISQKRLKRLAAAGYGNTQTYRRNVNHYPKLKDIKSKSELASRLSDLSRFISAETSTLSGNKSIMEKSLKTLHSHGFNFVNKSNYLEFGEFMAAYREKMLDMEYDSGDAADLYGITVKHKLDPEKVKEDFEWWLDNIEAAKELKYSSKSAGDYDKVMARTIVKSGVKKTVKAAMDAIKKGKKK